MTEISSVNGFESVMRTGAYESALGLDAASGKTAKLAGKEDKELMDACRNFESIFLFQLLKEMRKTVQKNELFAGGQGEEMFQGMLDMNFAEKMSQKGEGIGIARMMYDFLSRRQGIEAYKSAADKVQAQF